MIVFPKKSAKPKQGDSAAEVCATAVQVKKNVGIEALVSDDVERVLSGERVLGAYAGLRKARSDARLVGKRDKRRKAKEAEEAEKKK